MTVKAKKISAVLAALLLFTAGVVTGATIFSAESGVASIPGKITVEVDYGPLSEGVQTKTIAWTDGMTAMDAISIAADVNSKKVGKHTFVNSIGDIANDRGNMAWYYRVNNAKSKVLANNRVLKSGDYVRWTYTADVCSAKFDAGNKVEVPAGK